MGLEGPGGSEKGNPFSYVVAHGVQCEKLEINIQYICIFSSPVPVFCDVCSGLSLSLFVL